MTEPAEKLRLNLACPRCGGVIDDVDMASREVSHNGRALVHRRWHPECFVATFGATPKGKLV